MKAIGVLGGIGPQATMDFEARLHAVSQRLIPARENQGYPPLLVRYLRHAPVVLEDDNAPAGPGGSTPACSTPPASWAPGPTSWSSPATASTAGSRRSRRRPGAPC